MRREIKLLILAIVFFGGLFSAPKAFASVRCETQYGGGEICVKTGQLQIDKEVWNPETGKFVDNLGLSNYRFAPGEEIIFRLKIKNVGDETFGKIEVRDWLPKLLDLVNGNIAFDVTNLHPGDVREYKIKTKVTSADKFPSGKTLVCEVNAAEVWSGDERDKDTAQVCLTKKVLGVTILPKTGPEYLLIFLLLSSFAGIVGLSLIKAGEGSCH